MKALVGGSDDRILGFTMIGAEAGEVVAAVQMAMLADLPYSRFRDAIFAHPTMAEGLRPLIAGTAEITKQINSDALHGKQVVVSGKYYPSAGLIFVDKLEAQ